MGEATVDLPALDLVGWLDMILISEAAVNLTGSPYYSSAHRGLAYHGSD